MTPKQLILCLSLMPFLFAGCIPESRSYYLSPLDATSTYYHTIPMQHDSEKAVIYASGLFTLGASNYRARDNQYSFHTNVYRSHNFGHLQGYYGVGLTLGSYHVEKYDGYSFYRYPRQDSVFHIPESHRFFGAYSFQGGLNYVIPIGKIGEWRVLGLETSWNREFGEYLALRKSLPNYLIDILATYQWTRVVGITTEFVTRFHRGEEFGCKIAIGKSLVPMGAYHADSIYTKPVYFSNTFHVSFHRITGFIQLNMGTKSGNLQTGMTFKLVRRPGLFTASTR